MAKSRKSDVKSIRNATSGGMGFRACSLRQGLGMTKADHESAFSPRAAPELCIDALEERAQGMPGAYLHPQPRVQKRKVHEHQSPQVKPSIRHSLRNGFNGLLRALPGDRAFCHRHP